MAVTPILPVTFDALQAVALGDGFRDGQILEARITALLSDKLARIEVNGQPLVVTMTKPLPVGVALTLKVERDAGQLKLIAQGPAREMPAIADMPEAQVRDMLAIQLRDMPEARARDILKTLIRDLPEARLKDMPEARTGEKLDAWIRDMPEARVRDMLKAQVRDMPEALARDVLAARLRDMAGASIRAADPQRTTYNSAEPIKAALAKIQHLTVEAMLDDGPSAEPSLTQMLASMARPQAETATAQPLSPRLAPAASDTPPAATPGAAVQAAPDDGERAAFRIETPEFRQVHVAPESVAGQARPERTASFTVEIPIFLPGNNTPLRLNVTRDEEEADRDDDEPRSPYWTVRFAAEAGQLGMVHAAISLIEGHIGVQLRAERDETAERFTQHVSQLRDALHASNLKLDGITVARGADLADH